MAASLFDLTGSRPAERAILGLPSSDGPNVMLSAFVDEASGDPRVWGIAAQALGFRLFSGRSCTYKERPTHFEALAPKQLAALLTELYEHYGLTMAEFGSRLGKVYLQPDGTVKFLGQVYTKEQYFEYVARVAERAAAAAEVSTGEQRRLRVRMFDCYPREGASFEDCAHEAAEICSTTLALFPPDLFDVGFEVETNLMGSNAEQMVRMRALVGQRYRVVIDLGNLDSLGFGDDGANTEARALLPVAASWMHIKAFLGEPEWKPGQKVDEGAIRRFGPAHLDQAHELFLPALRDVLASNRQPFMVVLEPHYQAGGQFGGFSGPNGLGAALRSAQVALFRANIGCALTQYEDIRPDNGGLVTRL